MAKTALGKQTNHGLNFFRRRGGAPLTAGDALRGAPFSDALYLTRL
jgi:hypothetical protein